MPEPLTAESTEIESLHIAVDRLRADHVRDQLLVGLHKGQVLRLLGACAKAVEHMELGEGVSATRMLRKAIAATSAPVEATTTPTPAPIDASPLGVVADVLRLLREDPNARIAVVCAKGRDGIDRFEAVLGALRIVHGNRAAVWPGPLPGIRLAGQDDASVRFFVEGTPIVSYAPSVVIRDGAPVKLTREQLIERAALDCVTAGTKPWGDIWAAIERALKASGEDPSHPGEVDAVIESRMEQSANGDGRGHVYGLRTIEGKVA